MKINTPIQKTLHGLRKQKQDLSKGILYMQLLTNNTQTLKRHIKIDFKKGV